ncbi:MAG TPA: SPW repeat protein [Polyangia bacterium]|jgi:hypothetical protein
MAMEARRSQNPFLWARIVNLILGVWLFISAFVWPHTMPSQTNTWILGLLIVLFALFSTAQPGARWLNTLAAIWLFFSSLAIFHTSPATVWNNVIVAIVVFVVSFIGGYERRVTPTPTRTQTPLGV